MPDLTHITRASIEHHAQEKITERVEHIREQRGLSVRQLAKLMGLNYSSLSHRLVGRVQWSITDVLTFKLLFNVDVLEGLPNGTRE